MERDPGPRRGVLPASPAQRAGCPGRCFCTCFDALALSARALCDVSKRTTEQGQIMSSNFRQRVRVRSGSMPCKQNMQACRANKTHGTAVPRSYHCVVKQASAVSVLLQSASRRLGTRWDKHRARIRWSGATWDGDDALDDFALEVFFGLQRCFNLIRIGFSMSFEGRCDAFLVGAKLVHNELAASTSTAAAEHGPTVPQELRSGQS